MARDRDTWLKARDTAVRSANVSDLVQNRSELIDHEALQALQREGTSLESEPGGRALGGMVHAILATIPLDRPAVERSKQELLRSHGLFTHCCANYSQNPPHDRRMGIRLPPDDDGVRG